MNVSSVALVDLPAGPGEEVRTCVRCGLWLLDDDGERGRWAMLVVLAPAGSRGAQGAGPDPAS
ncbi:MAG: hypothetical protein M3Y91_16135 [Actinomycetota bacterium]|nr:hypothetical protein [Actinomycetota bacterium]